jgi:menaquinone-dependent protoporphyrinogen oxidase
MNDQILIAYATRAGSTADIAGAIGEHLGKRGFRVDVKSVRDNPSLEGYQAVILGSAIRMGSWLPEAISYIQSNRKRLTSLPTALFTVHMLNTGDNEESRVNRQAYLDKVRPLLPAAEGVFFEGMLDFSKLSFIDRVIANLVKAEEADNRDWEHIRGWTPNIVEREVINE